MRTITLSNDTPLPHSLISFTGIPKELNQLLSCNKPKATSTFCNLNIAVIAAISCENHQVTVGMSIIPPQSTCSLMFKAISKDLPISPVSKSNCTALIVVTTPLLFALNVSMSSITWFIC